MISAYPKIFAIGQKYIADIFETEVEISEKVDGSAFSFKKENGQVICRSKGKIQDQDNIDKLFDVSVKYARSLIDILPEGITFHCEYLKKPKHNTLCYNRVPKNNLMLFAIMLPDGTFIKDLLYYANMLDVEAVPILYQGKVSSEQQLKDLLDTVSVLGQSNIEGIVVKNYNKTVIVGGQVLPIMSGKYVSEAFKEVHHRTWKKENTGKGKWENFKEGYRTKARWQKAVNWLRDNGNLEDAPQDISKLLKRVKQDILEEEIENIKDFLWTEFGEELLRHSIKGCAEWYKAKLLRNPFEEKKDER